MAKFGNADKLLSSPIRRGSKSGLGDLENGLEMMEGADFDET